MSSQRSKQNRPCGCGENKYSFQVSEKNPNLQIWCCRSCSHRWLITTKPKREYKKYIPEDER